MTPSHQRVPEHDSVAVNYIVSIAFSAIALVAGILMLCIKGR